MISLEQLIQNENERYSCKIKIYRNKDHQMRLYLYFKDEDEIVHSHNLNITLSNYESLYESDLKLLNEAKAIRNQVERTHYKPITSGNPLF
jgi:hypothetical protein